MSRIALLLAVAALVACSSGASPSGLTARSASDPAEACRGLVSDVCAAVAACDAPEARDRTRQRCEASAYQYIYCADATALGPTYDRCQAEVRAVSCGAVTEAVARGELPWPASCADAIVIPRPDGGR